MAKVGCDEVEDFSRKFANDFISKHCFSEEFERLTGKDMREVRNDIACNLRNDLFQWLDEHSLIEE